jgi:RHS repeat-associated protein
MDIEKAVETTVPSRENGADLSTPVASISLPKGGGAIKGIGEKFGVNPVNGTGTLSVPVFTSPGRSTFSPSLTLSYDSGSGNGPFGFGWRLSVPAITRKTEKGLPRYMDAEESDVFILSEAEDLVPTLAANEDGWRRVIFPAKNAAGDSFTVHGYRPRIEGLFARIERWVNDATGNTHWKSVSKDNITSLYGVDAGSRIADPDNPGHVFTWLLAGTYDDRGNRIIYEYKSEDSSNVPSSVAELHRQVTANRYLKRIYYGNPTPYDPSTDPVSPADPGSWYFEAVFDYGEHDPITPTPAEVNPWTCRPDMFSAYRSGFEVRTFRLCSRVLMFHNLAGVDNQPGYQGLVRSTNFDYSADDLPPNRLNPIYSYLETITQLGYSPNAAGGYTSAALPSLDLSYTKAEVDPTIHFAAPSTLDNLPIGVDGNRYQWTDLDSEGSPGILSAQGNAWYFKRNVSNLPDTRGNIRATFEPMELVAAKPSTADLQGGSQQLMDLAGDGQLCLVDFSRPLPGYYERGRDRRWESFRPFAFSPNIDWKNPNLRMLDLDGDGFADILITEDEVFTWYPSFAKAGFGPAGTVRKPFDEDYGPALVFADGTQSIYVSDMSGDGLKDLVRVRNGEICYWPNRGYGRFGAKITMDASPVFDTPDGFEQRRLRLADIDGSGATDMLYLGRDNITFWYNQSGNSWSGPNHIPRFPASDPLDSVTVVDLLGNGTACLVWSSSSPGDSGRPLRYIDLMRGQKPHLLVHVINNLGAETKVHYVASTRFYLADRLAGQPWVTRLSFPVYVVDRVETFDWVSRNRFVTTYTYHHGYYDGIEREFRGFGRVDQQDAEELGILSASAGFPCAANIDAGSYVPPVLTKTWYHTGAYPMGNLVSRVYASEYYRESDLAEGVAGLPEAGFEAMTLSDTVLPSGLDGAEIREAIRSLKGSPLRQEVYALDGAAEADRPYKVSENNFTVKMLQPFGWNRHAVFLTHARETIDLQYERKLYEVNGLQLADPRVQHQMVLAFDEYGNELQSVAIGYGRRRNGPGSLLTAADQACQQSIHVTYTERSYTRAVLLPGAHRIPLPAETLAYELIQASPASDLPDITNLFGFAEMAGYVGQAGDGQHDILYEDLYAAGATNAGQVYRRLIADTRTIYLKNDLSASLAPGTMESMGLVYQSYRQAFTSGLLSTIYQRTQPRLPVQHLLASPAPITDSTGGYMDLDGNGNWWIPSNLILYSPVPANTQGSYVQDAAYAAANFYLPQAQQDPFQQYTTFQYDSFNLLLQATTDALGNTVTAQNDYRVLQPTLVTDPNANQTQVVLDALGLVAATAVMGKTGQAIGDSIPAGFNANLLQSDIDDFFANPLGQAPVLLGTATSRFVYDLGRFARLSSLPDNIFPAYAAGIRRETHVSDLAGLPASQGGVSKLQVGFTFSDGFGREIQRKAQAEPGPVTLGGPVVTPRWVGSGWTIFNNKGKPVRQYEPFFDSSYDFQYGQTVGVSPILLYDPLGRVIATIHPDQSWEKVVFDPWREVHWDANDTVLIPTASNPDPSLDPDVGAYIGRLPRADYYPTWYEQMSGGSQAQQDAAEKTFVHANTPTDVYLDPLGRSFLSIANNGVQNGAQQLIPTFTEIDIQGFQRSITDALDRKVMLYDYDMLGTKIHQKSVDAGERWMLNDALGKPIYRWDARGHVLQTQYDALRRPIRRYVLGTDPANSDPRTIPGAGSPTNGFLYERTVYGEVHPDSNPTPGTGAPAALALNLRGRVFLQLDTAGVVTMTGYDFSGNLLGSGRQVLTAYQDLEDWTFLEPQLTALPLNLAAIGAALAPPLLGTDNFTTSTTYDALNRPVTLTTPDASVTIPTYNEAKLLQTVNVNLQGAVASTPFVTDITYNAKGQRLSIAFGNGVNTAYTYDSNTFRLLELYTTRPSGINDLGAQLFNDPAVVQDLNYSYDPMGNITSILDNAFPLKFYSNTAIVPAASYTYDPIYRLIKATGCEQIAQAAFAPAPVTDLRDYPFPGLAVSPNDLQALENYTEQYGYDLVGNFQTMAHSGPGVNWTRSYTYNAATPTNNQLLSTSLGSSVVENYGYDLNGNMSGMSHLVAMQWDFSDRLLMTQQQVVTDGSAPQTWYQYDSTGQRVAKVNQTAGGAVSNQRIYLGGYELYREFGAGASIASTPTLERQTLHVMDDKQRIALVETLSIGPAPSGTPLIRYQFSNHLGSSMLELDASAVLLTYEVYYPFGGSSLQAVQNQSQTPKRYRYTGKERDEENGFYYHGARYYAPWLGRWVSCDPKGLIYNLNRFMDIGDGKVTVKQGLESTHESNPTPVNQYSYVLGNPCKYADPTGCQELDPREEGPEVSPEISPLEVAAYNEAQQTLQEHGVSTIGADHTAEPLNREEVEATESIAARYNKPDPKTEAAFDSLFPVSQETEDAIKDFLKEQKENQAEKKPGLSPADIISRIEEHVSQENKEIETAIKNKDATFLNNLGLKPGQVNVLLHPESRTFGLQYGNAMESGVSQALRSDPELSPMIKDIRNSPGEFFPTRPEGRSLRPDFGFENGPLEGQILDLTTPGQRDVKLEKYHDRVIVITYNRPQF